MVKLIMNKNKSEFSIDQSRKGLPYNKSIGFMLHLVSNVNLGQSEYVCYFTIEVSTEIQKAHTI